MVRVAFYTLGCKLNQAETESLAGQFRGAGYQLVTPDNVADIYIANTCTVTHVADRKSRHWLRAAKRRNLGALVIATGCYAQRTPQELAQIADLVIGNEEKEHLLEIGKDLSLPTSPSVMASPLLRHCEPFASCHSEGLAEALSRSSERSEETAKGQRPKNLTQDRLREAILPLKSITRVRSLIKIQDGCRSPCAYCIVPRVRAYEYSLPASQIIDEVKLKVALGYREVVLTGTKIGCYKDAVLSDSEGSSIDLRGLIERILHDTDIERLRLSSLQPQEISAEFLSLWQDGILNRSPESFASCHSEGLAEALSRSSERSEETAKGRRTKNLAQGKLREGSGDGFRLCRHLHLALQSGSDTVLQRMRRCYSLDDYQQAVNLIKETIPGVAITTDLMVGFPGESDEEFEQSYHFCQQAGFANIHVFPFSPRPGTLAARMPQQIDERVKKERKQRMLELAQKCRHSFHEQFLGQTMPGLWEKETSLDSGIYSGLTDNYIRVFTPSYKSLTNKIASVKLVRFHDQGIWGELVEN
ncbi:MAG: radical SAM protein [Dehalococcoidia bacterium]|nr:radical SAM protein [Dehalococcoidia bacterium]